MKKARVEVNMEVMRGPMWTVWNAIAADWAELGRVTNKGAVEATIDADRMTFFAYGEKGRAAAAAAEAELDRAIKAHGYEAVLNYLSRKVRLV